MDASTKMFENENNFKHLETIIKIEPEELEVIAPDYILRAKANIFSDPIVLLDRIHPENTKPVLVADQREKAKNQQKKTTALAEIGNEGLQCNEPHTCCFCQKVVKRRRCLSKHIEAVHCRSMKFSCDLCPGIYFTKVDMQNHLRIVHSKTELKCSSCDFKTKYKDGFKRHISTHSKTVECQICKKVVSSLKNHMKMHKPKENCSICQKIVGKYNMKAHIFKIHTKKDMKCNVCEEAFNSRDDLRRHKIRNHHDGQIYECHCGSVFISKEKLDRHQKVHSNELLKCKVCQKQFTLAIYLRIHWNKVHVSTYGNKETLKVGIVRKSGPFICDQCGSHQPKRNLFLAHLKFHRYGTIMHCDLCPQSFQVKFRIVKHMKRIHLNLRPFQCRICDHKSFTKDLHNCHMQVHGKKIECKICHKFVTNLKRHSRNHDKEECKICKKIYPKDRLKNHIKTHGKNGSFICKKCGSRQLSRHLLLKHYSKNHPTKRYCDLCPLTFEQRGRLTSHMNQTHLKLRPFKCELCEHKSYSQANLRAHMLRHGLKTECKICQKFVSNMEEHLKNHEKVKCKICSRSYSIANLPKHIKSKH